jgi:23S rRNA (cytosine1962-C5)-methyltransferase
MKGTLRPEKHAQLRQDGINDTMETITLKPGRDDSIHRRHPWIFSGAVQTENKDLAAGQTVTVASAEGVPLATGAYTFLSQIRIRLWSFDPGRQIGAEFFENRLRRAREYRNAIFSHRPVTAYRLVNAESDGLPGLIVDRYGDFLVCQFLSAGAEFWKAEIVEQLVKLIPVKGIYERSDGEGRNKEGLKRRRATLWGSDPPDLIEFTEGGIRFLVDVRKGHKTGFYLDQRENRALVSAYSRDASVLNCFAYTGGFGLQALKNGKAARVTNVESSAEALQIGRRHLEINGLNPDAVEDIQGDVFEVLRGFRDRQRQFDLVILDPPKFAAAAGKVKTASRGYKDINLLAIKLLRPGGILFTFSCSGHVHAKLFQKIVADAALDTGRDVHLVRHLEQAPDHPVALNFPEGAYLKGLICRVC